MKIKKRKEKRKIVDLYLWQAAFILFCFFFRKLLLARKVKLIFFHASLIFVAIEIFLNTDKNFVKKKINN